MTKQLPVQPINRTCPCQLAIALIDSADRLIHAALRGTNIKQMAERWVEERQKCCPDCPSREK